MSLSVGTCAHCGHALRPALSEEDYMARAAPRLAAIDALSAKIDFGSFSWRLTADGERWQRLMDEQGRDEVAAGL